MIEHAPPLVAQFANDASTALLVGPPGGLPAPVPDFVGGLLDTIGSFLDGSIDNLGAAVRAVTPGGAESAQGAADGASGR